MPLNISWFLVICSIKYVYIDKREVFIGSLPEKLFVNDLLH